VLGSICGVASNIVVGALLDIDPSYFLAMNTLLSLTILGSALFVALAVINQNSGLTLNRPKTIANKYEALSSVDE